MYIYIYTYLVCAIPSSAILHNPTSTSASAPSAPGASSTATASTSAAFLASRFSLSHDEMTKRSVGDQRSQGMDGLLGVAGILNRDGLDHSRIFPIWSTGHPFQSNLLGHGSVRNSCLTPPGFNLEPIDTSWYIQGKAFFCRPPTSTRVVQRKTMKNSWAKYWGHTSLKPAGNLPCGPWPTCCVLFRLILEYLRSS